MSLLIVNIFNFSSSLDLKNFAADIATIASSALAFLCKVLVESYHWTSRPEIRLQGGGGRWEEGETKRGEEGRGMNNRRGGIILDEPLGAARLSLVRTFYLILKRNRGEHLDEVPDCCWHALIIWFFEKK